MGPVALQSALLQEGSESGDGADMPALCQCMTSVARLREASLPSLSRFLSSLARLSASSGHLWRLGATI